MTNTHFSDIYKDQVFHIWYENDRPGVKKLYDLLDLLPDEEKPSEITLKTWKSEFGWEERADALDGEASLLLDQKVIQKRIEMWEKLEKTGEFLLEKGKSYLENSNFDEAGDAIRAITVGVDLLRASAGQAQAWAKIGSMTTDQINKEIAKLVSKTGTGGITIDAEVDEISD